MRLFDGDELLAEDMEFVVIAPFIEEENKRIGIYNIRVEYEDEDNVERFACYEDFDVVLRKNK